MAKFERIRFDKPKMFSKPATIENTNHTPTEARIGKITIEVGDNQLIPDGDRNHWEKLALAYKQKNNLTEVVVHYETRDTESNCVLKHFLCRL